MKYSFSIVIVLMITFSCSDKYNRSKTEVKVSKKEVLISSINEILNLYIKEYPIPKKSNNNIYYTINFNDDEFTIMRLGFPAPKEIEMELKGIFYNHDSIPISIFDKKNISNSKYYNSSFFNQVLTNKFFLHKQNISFDETFPPIWKYNIENNQLSLIKKDTIWKVWE